MARKARKAAKKRTPARAKPKRKAKPRPRPKKAPPPKAKAPKPPKAVKPAAPAIRPIEFEEETVCSIEFLSDNRSFIARLDTQRGGMREHKAPSFTDLLELVAEDLREEFLEA